MSDESYIHQLPYDDDLLDRLARLLLARPQLQPVDLSQCVVLFPDIATRQRFRRKLLDVAGEQGVNALIPPVISSLKSWLEQFRPNDKRTLHHNEQELFLLQALTHYPRYLRRYGTWPLIDSLLSLFQELTLNNVRIDDDEDVFRRSIEIGYGATNLAPLNDEATLVHTLWQAWLTDLQQQNCMDYATAHVTALTNCVHQLSADTHLYLAGFQHYSAAEQQWIDVLGQRGQIDVLAYSATSTHLASSEYGSFLDAVFAPPEVPLLLRSKEQLDRVPTSPASARLQVLEARNLEQEARGIDIQVRQWLLQGRRNIGIVCNDRRLARRVRALQERADIKLIDGAGWPLSTTSAASVIMRWLDCIDTNFHSQSLLDLLLSPFLDSTDSRSDYQDLIGHFEEFVMYRAGVITDLTRYLDAIERQRNIIDELAGEGTGAAVVELLNKIKSAAEPLHDLVTIKEATAEIFFNALQSSLTLLGVWQTLEHDEAGVGVKEEIESLVRCVSDIPHLIDWGIFRSWLARSFERSKFKPVMTGSGVELMGFAESRLYQFDALVIGGATREHLPGSPSGSPFFNESVRAQLELPSGLQSQRERLSDFQHLLHAAPHILVTCSAEDKGSPQPKSPWLQRLQSFHQHTYGSALVADDLRHLTDNTQVVLTSDQEGLPAAEIPPRVKSPVDLLPPVLSASGYQRLIDCPFRFFSSSHLGLQLQEDSGEDLEKKDYGTRVHRILQAFHTGTAGLPGPFTKSLTTETHGEAAALLLKIAEIIFARDIQMQPSAQGWLNLWQRVIPHYLAWQQQRQQRWTTGETEHDASMTVHTDPDLAIGGRIDRIDHANDELSLIDYKTGKAPTKKKVASGESIQLLFYALMAEKRPIEVMALELGDEGVASAACLQNEQLHALLDEEMSRLHIVVNALFEGTELPAWGDPETCSYCEFDGICRKDLWAEPS